MPQKPRACRFLIRKFTHKQLPAFRDDLLAMQFARNNRLTRCHHLADLILDALDTPDDKGFALALYDRVASPLNIAGAAYLTKKRNMLYVEYICTLSKCRGGGAVLMNHIVKLAKASKIPYVGLKSVDTAMPFYDKMGMIRGWPFEVLPGGMRRSLRKMPFEKFVNDSTSMPYYIKIQGVPNGPVEYNPLNLSRSLNAAVQTKNLALAKRLAPLVENTGPLFRAFEAVVKSKDKQFIRFLVDALDSKVKLYVDAYTMLDLALEAKNPELALDILKKNRIRRHLSKASYTLKESLRSKARRAGSKPLENALRRL